MVRFIHYNNLSKKFKDQNILNEEHEDIL